MTPRFGSLRTPCLIFALTLASGCGLGGGRCGAECGMKSTCASIGSGLTAREALSAAQAQADGVVGAGARWVGAVKGLKITRAGTPSPEPESEIFGVKVYASGWVFKYCQGLDEVVFGAGPPETTVEKGCGNFNCAQVTPTMPPAIDSAQAIAAAFPDDPPDALYGLDFNVLLGTRDWRVTKLPSGPSVLVDGDTGAVK